MRFSLKENLKKHKIKFIIASVLFAVLILSFFFSKSIENFLKLDNSLSTHQTTNLNMKKSEFSVNYIDVGQGSSTYIRLPDNKIVLIDGGNAEYGEKVAKTLKNDGVEKIDFLIASHADADHIAGLNFILKEFEVKNIFRPFQIAGSGENLDNFEIYEDEDLKDIFLYLNEIEKGKTKISRITTDVYKSFITNIYNEFYEEEGIFYHSNVTVFYDGLKIEGENYLIEFYSPLVRDGNYDLSEFSNTNGFATIGYGTDNSNDNSAIMLITIFEYKFLFTGDSSWTSNIYEESTSNHSELDFVESLTDEEKLKFSNISVFLLGHHGSSFSTGEEILNLTSPDFFVVSVNEKNSYDHPAKDTLARISSYKKFDDYLLLTSDCGTISFGAVGGKLQYSLQNYDENMDLSISWIMLGSIIFIFCVYVLFSIKTKPSIEKRL